MPDHPAAEAFKALLTAVQESQELCEVTLRARPVVGVEHPGGTLQVVPNDLPEGTIPAEPDSLALELHVGGANGRPVSAAMLAIAAEHGLRVGTSDLLLV